MQLMESKSVQLQQLQMTSSQQLKAMEDRVEQEEATVAALRRDVAERDDQLKELDGRHSQVAVCLDQLQWRIQRGERLGQPPPIGSYFFQKAAVFHRCKRHKFRCAHLR